MKEYHFLKNTITKKDCENYFQNIDYNELNYSKPSHWASDTGYGLMDIYSDLAGYDSGYLPKVNALHGTFMGMNIIWWKNSEASIKSLPAMIVYYNSLKQKLTTLFDNKKLSELAPQNVQNSSKALIKQLPSIKETLYRITNSNNIEVIKPFTTVFAQGFLNDYKKNYSGDNPMDYFQKGIEVLYLFMDEIRETDNSFYLELSNYGEYITDIDLIIEDINSAVK